MLRQFCTLGTQKKNSFHTVFYTHINVFFSFEKFKPHKKYSILHCQLKKKTHH